MENGSSNVWKCVLGEPGCGCDFLRRMVLIVATTALILTWAGCVDDSGRELQGDCDGAGCIDLPTPQPTHARLTTPRMCPAPVLDKASAVAVTAAGKTATAAIAIAVPGASSTAP